MLSWRIAPPHCRKTVKLIKHAFINHGKLVEIEEFFNIERLGVECQPKCGKCCCGECPIGGKEFTIKEEREMKLIEDGLTRKSDNWVASYPWIRDPLTLSNNQSVAFVILKGTEKRLLRDEARAARYKEQIEDMLKRNVAIKLSDYVLKSYNGPIHYISHPKVLKSDFSTTPCRIVFNSSAKFNGLSLNDYWTKGPDVMNNMLGILLRFRRRLYRISRGHKRAPISIPMARLGN